MSAVNKTGKWDPVWVRISPRKPAAMNPEVALTASRVSSPAEDSRWRNFPVSGKSSLARVVPPDARGRLITVNPPRGPGGRWGRSGEKRATRGGEINQSSSATTSPPLREQEAPRWWLYDGWLIQDPSRSTVMDHSEPETGHWPRLRSCWLGGGGGLKEKERRRAGTETCWRGRKEAVGCTGAFVCFPSAVWLAGIHVGWICRVKRGRPERCFYFLETPALYDMHKSDRVKLARGTVCRWSNQIFRVHQMQGCWMEYNQWIEYTLNLIINIIFGLPCNVILKKKKSKFTLFITV